MLGFAVPKANAEALIVTLPVPFGVILISWFSSSPVAIIAFDFIPIPCFKSFFLKSAIISWSLVTFKVLLFIFTPPLSFLNDIQTNLLLGYRLRFNVEGDTDYLFVIPNSALYNQNYISQIKRSPTSISFELEALQNDISYE